MKIELISTKQLTREGGHYCDETEYHFHVGPRTDIQVRQTKAIVDQMGEINAQVRAFKMAAEFIDPMIKEL